MELLVVLSLVSLITALVMPNLTTLYRSFSNTLALEEIVRQINGVGYKAHTAHESYLLTSISVDEFSDTGSSTPSGINIDLPEGWSLVVQKPVSYSASGACTGGALKIFFLDTLRQSSNLTPPYCQVN